MRVSLVARFVSHPSIDFGSGRRSARRQQLGLRRGRTVYHRSRRVALPNLTIHSLRSHTSGFRFPPLGRLRRMPARRVVPSFGLPRARRA